MDSATNNVNNNNSNNNWRNDLSQDSILKIVNKIMDTLQRHMPFTGPDGMSELRLIAVRFEEKICSVALDEQDYLRKISLKMLSLRNHVSRDGNPLAAVSSGSNQKPLDTAFEIPLQGKKIDVNCFIPNISRGRFDDSTLENSFEALQMEEDVKVSETPTLMVTSSDKEEEN